jgi:hypothetical protein
VTSYEVVRNLILLGTVIVNVFKIGLGNTPLTSMPLINSNGNILPILERDPLTYIVMSPLGHNSRHLAIISRLSLVMLNEVT